MSGGAYVVLGVLAVLLVMAVAYVMTHQLRERQQEQGCGGAPSRPTPPRARPSSSAPSPTSPRSRSSAWPPSRRPRRRASTGSASCASSRVSCRTGSWVSTTTASVTRRGRRRGRRPPPPPTDPAALPTPKANLVGCTPRQSEVARMMVRLEQMYRVTDVTLNESAREQAGASDTTLQSCGTLYKFDLTVTLQPGAARERGAQGRDAGSRITRRWIVMASMSDRDRKILLADRPGRRDRGVLVPPAGAQARGGLRRPPPS